MKDCLKELFHFLSWTLGKLFSARFLAFIALIATICWISIDSMSKYVDALIEAHKITELKDIVMLVIGALINLTGVGTTFYFLRRDRFQPDNEGGK